MHVVLHQYIPRRQTSSEMAQMSQRARCQITMQTADAAIGQMTNLHEVSCCDCLANVAVVVFGPEVCALHLNAHACADANLHNKSLQPSHKETPITGCMRLQTLQLELQYASCCTESAMPEL